MNKPIKLLGIQHFGSDGGEHTVSIEVKDTATNLTVVKRSGTFTSKMETNNNYYGFFVSFGYLVSLNANKQYTLESFIKGPNSWYGEKGETFVKAGGVQFTFSDPTDTGNSTTVARGQFPAFIFI